MVLVSNDQIIIEVDQFIPLSILINSILCVFVLDDFKLYNVDFCYQCLVYMNKIRNSYHYIHIEDDE